MKITPIRINDDIDICVYFCFILDKFGALSESVISETVISADAVNYFELMGKVGFMLKKKLISETEDTVSGERIYTLLGAGKELVEQFCGRIPLGVREKTVEAGNETLKRLERERSIKCYISYNSEKHRYDLNVKFLNEINGDILLEMKLYAPDSETAQKMMKRFLSRPSFIITRTMNMFLKDDFFMFDN